jgi:hypothetical protein
VVHAIILATWKAKIGRITIPGQTRQKVHKTPCQPMSEYGRRTSVILAMQGKTNRRLVVQAKLGRK